MILPTCLAGLADFRRWVGWRWVEKANGRRDKPPVRLDHPDWGARSNTPADWGLFVSGLRQVEAGKLDGLGYVTAEDRERVFVDLDDCRNPTTGELDDWAQQLVDQAETYVEITPSGCGLRIIGLAGDALPEPIHTPYRLAGGGHGEVYYRAVRYVTVTGDRLPGTPDALAEIGDLVLDLLAAAGRAKAAEGKPARRTRNPWGFDPDNPSTPIGDVVSALAEIPNLDLEWDDWVKVGLAVFRATDGSDEGREAWRAWSAKSSKHHDGDLDERWDHFGRSPPSRIGFGSLHYAAQQANPDWVPPSWRPRAPEEGADRPFADANPGANPGANPFEGVAEPPKGKPRAPRERIRFGDWGPSLDARDFVEDFLTEGGLSVLYGESNAGKTFLATDIGLHVAAGRMWFGREVDAGGVLYLAMEGRHGIANRIAAWKLKHHYTERTDVPFTVIPATVNLLDPEADVPSLIEDILDEATVLGVPMRLVVVDTLARSMGGANENSSEDMGALVAAADAIRAATGAHVLFVHHSGKDAAKGSRGHSSLRAGIDTEIEILRPENAPVGTIKIRKQRDLAKGPDTFFALDVVELGLNRRHKPVTSCTVRPIAEEERPKAPIDRLAGLKGLQKLAMAALLDIIGTQGRNVVSDAVPRSARCVTEDEWQRAFDARSTSNRDRKTKGFNDASAALLADKRAIKRDAWVWVPTKSE